MSVGWVGWMGGGVGGEWWKRKRKNFVFACCFLQNLVLDSRQHFEVITVISEINISNFSDQLIAFDNQEILSGNKEECFYVKIIYF